MDKKIRQYLSQIGARGGKKSKRKLLPDDARKMVLLREARRTYKKMWAKCFWSFDKDYQITAGDIPWVAEQLMKNGDREAWRLAAKLSGTKLCR